MAEAETYAHTSVGRIKIRVRGEGSGPWALLWPSLFTDGPGTWGPQVETLEAHGWCTILVDPPGHGGSDRPPVRFSMEDCADAAVAILDRCSVQRAVLMGVSWGGFVALRVALRAPARVTALVLSNTSAERAPLLTRIRDSILPLLIRTGIPGGIGRFVMSFLLAPEARRDPELTAMLADKIDSFDRIGLARTVRSVLVDRTSVLDELANICIPTLVLAGELDTTIPPSYAVRIAAGIKEARFERIAGAAHLATRDDPEAVSRSILRFLASC